MKYILVSMAGASDHAADELGGKTPLELAKIPNLNFFAKIGRVGQVKLVSDRWDPSSDVTLLNLLGFDADHTYTGLGPLEAANLELKLEENEIPFRMNFVTESAGVLADPTAGHITTKEAKGLINFLNKKVSSDFVRFFPGSEYRHIAVIKDAHGYDALAARTYPPDSFVGEKIDTYLPKGPGSELLKKLMYDAKLLLQDHEINQVRVDLKENPANMIWLWGQGKKPKLKKFGDVFGLSGAIVTSAEYAKGIARLTGLTVLEVNGQREELAEQYEKKTKLLLEALEEKDFVCVYVRDCDDAGQDGDLRTKISALEAADFFILSKIKNYLEQSKEVRVLVTTCHTTPWKTRKRVRDLVPFVIAGKNVMPDECEKFSELAAKSSEMKIQKATELLPLLLAK